MTATAVKTYYVAHAKTDGSWDILEVFDARDDHAAMAYAEFHHYGDENWYVLDEKGRNINAW